MDITDPMDYVRFMVGTLAVENALLRRHIEELTKLVPKAPPPNVETPAAPNVEASDG